MLRITLLLFLLAAIMAKITCQFCHAQDAIDYRVSKREKDSLRNLLENMLSNDQKYRWMIMFGELDEDKIKEFKKMDEIAQYKRMIDAQNNIVGISKLQKDSLGNIQEEIDSANFFKLLGIINRYGFPHKYIEPYKVTTIFMHCPQRMNDPLFNILKREVKYGNLPAIEYARIYDLVQRDRHLPELYYVNKRFDTLTGISTVGQPFNIDETNKARLEIGLKKYKK